MARPQEFDRSEVLKSAMQLFQQQGYGATSVPDIVKATKLQPGSLYAAFKNKKGILIEAVQSYTNESVAHLNQLFAANESALEGIHKFLLQTAELCKSEAGRHGCLMVNTLLEMCPEDAELQELLGKQMGRIENRLIKQLQKAQGQGELAADQDPKVLAKFLLTNLWGLKVLSKTQAKPAEIKAVVKQVIAHMNNCAECH